MARLKRDSERSSSILKILSLFGLYRPRFASKASVDLYPYRPSSGLVDALVVLTDAAMERFAPPLKKSKKVFSFRRKRATPAQRQSARIIKSKLLETHVWVDNTTLRILCEACGARDATERFAKPKQRHLSGFWELALAAFDRRTIRTLSRVSRRSQRRLAQANAPKWAPRAAWVSIATIAALSPNASQRWSAIAERYTRNHFITDGKRMLQGPRSGIGLWLLIAVEASAPNSHFAPMFSPSERRKLAKRAEVILSASEHAPLWDQVLAAEAAQLAGVKATDALRRATPAVAGARRYADVYGADVKPIGDTPDTDAEWFAPYLASRVGLVEGKRS